MSDDALSTLTAPEPQVVRRAVHRTAWTVLDQGISSLTTLVALAVLARRLDADGFGAVSIALAVCTFGVGLARALGTDPLVVRYSGAPAEAWPRGAGRALGGSMVVGAVGGLVALVVATQVEAPLQGALLVTAVVLPGLCLQDGWRFAFFTLGRPARAAANDAVWTVLFIVLVLGPFASVRSSAAALTAIWAAGALVAAGVGILQSGRVWPRPARAAAWFHEHRDLCGRFAIEFVLLSGTTQLVLIAVGAWHGLDEAGSMRAATLVLGPAGVVANGLLAATVPEGARLAQRRDLVRWLVPGFALCASAVILVWGVFVRLLPEAIGRELLAGRWVEAQPLMIPLAFVYAGLIAATVFAAGLRSLGAARQSLRLIGVVTAAMLLGGAWGAERGAIAACWGMAVPAWLGAAGCGLTWHAQLDRFHQRTTAPHGTPEPT